MIKKILTECKKILIYNHCLLFLMLLLVAELISCCLSFHGLTNSHYQRDMDTYYSKWGGYIDENTIESIEKYAVNVNKQNDKDILLEQYKNGELSYEEYRNQYDALIESGETMVFREFYKRYQYAAEKPEARMLINTEGIQYLFTFKGLDIIFLLGGIMLSVLIASSENNNNMLSILRTTHYGRSRLIVNRMIALTIMLAVWTLAVIMVKYAAVIINYGSVNLMAPLESIESCCNTAWNVNILTALIISWMCMFLGVLFCGMLGMLIITCTGAGYIGFWVELAAAVVPYYLYIDKREYVGIPLPSGMLTGTIMLSNIKTSGYVDPYSGTVYYSMKRFIFCLVIIMVAILCMEAASFYAYVKKKS